MVTTPATPRPRPASAVPLDDQSLLEALDRAQAVIEFELNGQIITANGNFLAMMGYQLEEVVGQPHRIFCDAAYAEGQEYAKFWDELAQGVFCSGEYRRLAKDGREVWLQATYNPILNSAGEPVKIVKFASEITPAKLAAADYLGKVAAIERSQAVVEFDLNGIIITANERFLDTMGYELQEIVGKHHRMFCAPEHAQSDAYAALWTKLGAGRWASGMYRRLGKGGREVWLQATYNPILDPGGRPLKVVKFATDVTVQRADWLEAKGKVAAIDRSQASIEFDLEGHVLGANGNFLAVMGYESDEVLGKHHRMFCDPEYGQSQEYLQFWERLAAGKYATGEFKRLGKDGREVWIQATYNPILDEDGKPWKVVKFASDVTSTKLRNAEIEARVDAVDRSQAVIEFDLDGYVLSAKENFLRTIGYSQREIVGQHHSLFCAEEYRVSEEYRDFWLRLGKGEAIGGRFHRKGKFGRDVHIRASYSPVLDLAGRPVKVIKYAHDITAAVEQERRVLTGTREMTASVQALLSSIDEIAEGSSTASGLAERTHGNAAEGAEALRAALAAIEKIQRSSVSIAEIVRVMGEIANQTNLLAFNASIEAARAGEHGVGFSIVAGEVRKLAERSFEASQQIGTLIQESADRVAEGAAVSRTAEQAFAQIVEGVARSSAVIALISASTSRQLTASQEVGAVIAALAAVDATGDGGR